MRQGQVVHQSHSTPKPLERDSYYVTIENDDDMYVSSAFEMFDDALEYISTGISSGGWDV